MTCEACNTIPPVVASGYTPKGKWEEIGGLNTYVTGCESSAKFGLVDVYDIFGAANQTLQGADLLAAALNVVVLVPDFFKGEACQGEWFSNPRISPENDAKKNAFMAKAMDFPPHLEALAAVVQAANVRFKDINSWGGIGLCWGGKVVALLSGPGSIFSVSGQVHPGRLAKEDAEKISIPHIVLASNGEDAKVVEEYKEILEGREEGKARGVVETYGTMHHGWMGARAKLGEEENLKEYERGYNQLAAFFGKHLK